MGTGNAEEAGLTGGEIRGPGGDGLDDGREEPIGGDPEFDKELEMWLDEKNHEALPAKIILYKFKNAITGEDKEQCCQWVNELPDQHSIGLKFGSGRYFMAISVPPGKKQRKLSTSRRFSLHPYYDTLRKEEQSRAFVQGPAAAQGAIPQPQRVVGVSDPSLALLERVFTMLTPILQAAMRPPVSPGAEMVQSYQALSHVLRESALENQALLTDMTRKQAGLVGYADNEGDNEMEVVQQPKPSLIETILPSLMPIIEKLIGGGPQAAAAGAVVKAMPQFKQITSDPRGLSEIINALDKDRRFGPDKVNAMLKQLKIARPQGRTVPRPVS